MAEQRLIDANALIDWLTRATGFQTSCDDCTDIDCLDCVIEKAIKNAPTVEAKPVVHAHWEYHGGDDDMELYGFCSYCGKGRLTEDDILRLKPLLCPYCGAKMDEKEG